MPLKAPAVLLSTALLTGGVEESVVLEGIPHVTQKPDFCGEACAEMALRKLGSPLDQDDVFAFAGIDPALGRGLTTPELKRALDRIGFRTGSVWYSVDPDESDAELRGLWRAVHADLRAGLPSIVCMHYDSSPNTTEHFRLIVGWDAESGEVIYHEPAVAGAPYRRMKLDRFLALWPLKYRDDAWTVVRIRLEPGELRSSPPPQVGRFSPADYAQHVRELREERLPRGFSVVIEPPFVVVGDESEDRVKKYAAGTVRWAVEKLKADYFPQDPENILDIWLFKNSTSYEKNVRKIFNESPGTPYGYYSRRLRALIMNIGTGGGTLVHEIVHPFVEANITDCPAWLNEGLGSLYEQCGEKDGRIYGYTNWRLEGLQESMREGAVPSFEKLTAMSDDRFYGRGSGTHYAASRYLLYYLQERGLLLRFYRAFHANRDRDPTGYEALVSTLGREDMKAFEAEWTEFVLGLRFP